MFKHPPALSLDKIMNEYRIKLKCSYCGKAVYRDKRQLQDPQKRKPFCQACRPRAYSGKNNPNWRKGSSRAYQNKSWGNKKGKKGESCRTCKYYIREMHHILYGTMPDCDYWHTRKKASGFSICDYYKRNKERKG